MNNALENVKLMISSFASKKQFIAITRYETTDNAFAMQILKRKCLPYCLQLNAAEHFT